MTVPTRVLITGSRAWSCLDLALRIVNRLLARYGPDLLIVHGDCATGVDAAFEDACQELGVATEPHPVDWSMGRKAGPVRNGEMVRADAVLCITVSKNLAESRGTKDCARQALAAGIPVYLIDGDDAEPRRVTTL